MLADGGDARLVGGELEWRGGGGGREGEDDCGWILCDVAFTCGSGGVVGDVSGVCWCTW